MHAKWIDFHDNNFNASVSTLINYFLHWISWWYLSRKLMYHLKMKYTVFLRSQIKFYTGSQ